MRTEGHLGVVLFGRKVHEARTDAFQPLDEFGAGVAGEDPGAAVEKLGIGGLDALALLARHGVAADKAGQVRGNSTMSRLVLPASVTRAPGLSRGAS